MKITFTTFILASYGYSALAAPTYLTRRHEEENGKQAQLLNAAFDELSSADRCAQAPFDVGSKACINGSIAVCSTEGDWEVQGPCPNAGETCLAVPLTNGHGTDVQCISIAQAEKLIDSTGVDGGLKGDGTTDLPSESTCTESPEPTETGDATVNPPQISIGLGDDFEPSEPTPTDSESSVDNAVPTPEPTGTIEEDGGQGKGKGQVTVTVTVSESPSEEVSETITVTETLGATPTEEVGGGNPTSDFVKPTEFSPIPISSTTTTEAEALPTDSASSVETTESADAIETSLSASPTDTFITSIVGSAVDVPQATTTPAAKPSIPPLVDPSASASAPPAPAPTAPSAIVPDIQPIEGISFIPLEQSGSEGEVVGDDGDAKDPEEDSGYYY